MKEELENSIVTQAEPTDAGMSRRKFLRRGALTVGAAGVAASGSLGLLANVAAAQTCGTLPGTVKHPRGTWGYPTGGLDPAVCAERAYHGWWQHFCCWAVMDGVIGTLQEELGTPYTNLDLMAFKFGAGGINGWGTVCGTPLAAALAVNIIAGVEGGIDKGSQMSNDLMAYYAASSMPVYTPVSSDYAAKGGTAPAYMDGGTIPTSTADSPLCHVSVSKWLQAANAAAATDPAANPGYTIVAAKVERKERCARLAGTMAYKTVELLNAWKAGTYTPGAWGGPGSAPNGAPVQNNCTDCHGV
ncbi:MAG: hypothetical protein C4534_09645 [Gaiellales bacterium]|nr:MAG: hypothetical protein C4534_09645 [Gaiellales bacterium]